MFANLPIGINQAKLLKPVIKALCVIATVSLTAMVHDASAEGEKKMAKVTGIGGVFFLSNSDEEALAAWYAKHLGIKLEEFGGSILKWEDDTAEDGGMTVWHVAERNSEWFSPSESRFMINYRVDDLETLIEQLTDSGVEILNGPEYHENGVFAWIMDPEGNKIELWEPKIWDDKNKK